MVTTLRKLNWKFFDSVLHGCVVQIMTGDNTSVTQTDPRWQDCQVASHEQFQSGQGHGFRAGSPGLGVMLVENHVLFNQRDIVIINSISSTLHQAVSHNICFSYLDNCSMAKVLQFLSGENANREAGEWWRSGWRNDHRQPRIIQLVKPLMSANEAFLHRPTIWCRVREL